MWSLSQAVDVVGQAGKPKTITGFQTHTTPVLLAYGERAELATDECILEPYLYTCSVLLVTLVGCWYYFHWLKGSIEQGYLGFKTLKTSIYFSFSFCVYVKY